MGYIAYLDLLGTKDLSTHDADAYRDSIKVFSECLERSLADGCEAYAFSDCAYLESKSLTQIISTLDILRSELLMQQRFLTAAVTSGTLGASVLNKGALHCQNFSGAAISRVYVAQSSLKGIGILIDPALINMRNPAQNKFPKVNCFWIHNFYVSNINKLSELTPFYDLQINPDENQLSAYLDYTLREYRKANIKSKRYGRYYISPRCVYLFLMNLFPPRFCAVSIMYVAMMHISVRTPPGLAISSFIYLTASIQKTNVATSRRTF